MRKPRGRHILTPILSTLMGTFMKRLASVTTLLPTYMKASGAPDPLLLAFPTIECEANRLVLVSLANATLRQSDFAGFSLAPLAFSRLALALPIVSVLIAVRWRCLGRLGLRQEGQMLNDLVGIHELFNLQIKGLRGPSDTHQVAGKIL